MAQKLKVKEGEAVRSTEKADGIECKFIEIEDELKVGFLPRRIGRSRKPFLPLKIFLYMEQIFLFLLPYLASQKRRLLFIQLCMLSIS